MITPPRIFYLITGRKTNFCSVFFFLPALLLGILLTTDLYAQSNQIQCYTVSPTNNVFPPNEECEYTTAGPIAVALNIYILRNSDGSEGLSNAQIPLIDDRLEEYFRPHGVYFLTKCVSEIRSTYYYIHASELISSEYVDPTAINIFIRPGSGGGLASGVPSRGASLQFDNEVNPNTIAHEIGHCLGLYHTFRGSPYNGGGEGGTTEQVDGGNCCTAGDLVCDTPADPNITPSLPQYGGTGAQPDCTWLTPPVLDPEQNAYTNVDIHNIMSYYYNECTDRFTPGQGARMRHVLATSGLLQSVRRDGALISSNTVWNTNKELDSDVWVLSGSQLKIENAVVKMAPGRKIIVEKGASLDVRNATLTVNLASSSCQYAPPFWKGIELRGGETASEFPSYVYLWNSTVEFAEKAVYYPPGRAFGSYGRVRAYLTTFRNNINSVELVATTPMTSFYNTLYNQLFVRCDFILDENFPGNVVSHNQALFGYIPKISMVGCTFTRPYDPDIITSPGENYGIIAYRSNLTINAYCTGCSPTFYRPSEFSGFRRSVRLIESHGSSVRNTRFEKSRTGLTVRQSNNVIIRDCEFEIADMADTQRSGIFLDESTGYTVLDNVFTNANPGIFTANRGGIWVFNSGPEPNQIARNSFKDLRFGIRVEGQNANSSAPAIGLNLFCNGQNNPGSASVPAYDFYVPFSSIALFQGSSSKSAGNVFSRNTAPLGADYYKTGSVITYYYYIGDPDQNPVNHFGLEPIGINILPDCASLGFFDPEDPDKIHLLQAQYLDLKDEYDQLIDGGNTPGWVQTATTATSQNANTVKNQLLALSPYLSAAVLAAVHENASAFSSSSRYSILSANPDALKDGDLRGLIQNSPVKLSTTYRQNLLSLNKPLTARTYREMELNDLSQELATGLNGFIQLAYQDTTLANLDEARAWLDLKDGYQNTLQKAESWFLDGNLVEYDLAVQELAFKYGANPEYGIDAYEAFASAKIAALSTSLGLFGLSQTELDDLEQEALNTPSSLVRSMISNFLLVYYGIDIAGQTGQKTAGAGATTPFFTPADLNPEPLTPGWLVYPNPARDRIVIGGSRATGQANIDVYDVFGRFARTFQTELMPGGTELQLGDLRNGVYFFRIRQEGQIVYWAKIVLNR